MSTGGVFIDRSNEDLFKSNPKYEKKQAMYLEKWTLSKFDDIESPWVRFVIPEYEKLITDYPAWWFSEKNNEENSYKILGVSIKNKKIKTKTSKPRRKSYKF